jgi:hypothetical protein
MDAPAPFALAEHVADVAGGLGIETALIGASAPWLRPPGTLVPDLRASGYGYGPAVKATPS